MMRVFYMLVMFIIASNALAATVNGSLTVGNKGSASFNSQGSFDISVTKGDAVQISNLNSIVISSPNGGATNRTASDDVCYYAMTTQYSIDMNSNNNYTLVNSINAGQTIPYSIYWDDGKDGSVDKTFTSNANAASIFSSNNRISANCQTTSGSNATITIFIRHQDYNGNPTGLYTDTVNIILKAQ